MIKHWKIAFFIYISQEDEKLKLKLKMERIII